MHPWMCVIFLKTVKKILKSLCGMYLVAIIASSFIVTSKVLQEQHFRMKESWIFYFVFFIAKRGWFFFAKTGCKNKLQKQDDLFYWCISVKYNSKVSSICEWVLEQCYCFAFFIFVIIHKTQFSSILFISAIMCCILMNYIFRVNERTSFLSFTTSTHYKEILL